MILKARELIQNAEKYIYLSVWKREFKLLKKDLENAAKRKVDIILFSFTETDLNYGALFSYSLDEKELEKFWAHKVILIADKNELLMGDADTAPAQRTAWTRNRALIDIATNHIILDITIFGIRFGRNVAGTVSRMQNGETANLGKIMHDKYPKIAF